MSASNSTSASDRQLSSRLLPCSTTKRRRIHSTEADPPPPATTIVQLGDDFLVEILIRLPNPRSACRCKAVCKRWKSLISNPIRFNRRFVSHHQSRNRQPVLLLPSDDPQAIIRSVIPMTTLLTQSSFAVMDSYKDLVLCGFSDRIGKRNLQILLPLQSAYEAVGRPPFGARIAVGLWDLLYKVSL
ncbi:unnamed protein product [Linum tenue]|uniref:F-box domain-containing protein n=1 Tax=Linum tenue TaxID=586396 RepID=A0AAV0JWG3_9ROSI|nr:unnamed protein product [Linum tenue]